MLDPNIIMGGQQLNVLGAMEAGRAAAESQIGLNRQNALASLYKTQGPQIMAGDANALNALARFDPNAAMGVQGTQLGLQGQRQDLAFDAERMQMARDEAKANAARAIQERADQMSAQEAAAEAAKVEKGVAAAMAAQTPEQWDAMARQFGVPDLVGQFANREAIAGSYMGVADALKEFTPKVAEPLSKEGKLAADIASGFVPAGTAATPETVINMGEGDKFYDNLDKSQAEMFTTLMNDGIQASRTIGLVDRLDGLLKTTPTGGAAAFKSLAGQVGIDLGGLGDVQAVEAVINQIVPQQRQPGSGPMSDADLALFKKSVPRLINQPGGNQLIIETMRGIAAYTMEQSAIAEAVANREITPAEGRKRLRALANPLEGFGSSGSDTGEKPSPVVIDGFTIEAVE